jgi:hypothetical protein
LQSFNTSSSPGNFFLQNRSFSSGVGLKEHSNVLISKGANSFLIGTPFDSSDPDPDANSSSSMFSS